MVSETLIENSIYTSCSLGFHILHNYSSHQIYFSLHLEKNETQSLFILDCETIKNVASTYTSIFDWRFVRVDTSRGRIQLETSKSDQTKLKARGRVSPVWTPSLPSSNLASTCVLGKVLKTLNNQLTELHGSLVRVRDKIFVFLLRLVSRNPTVVSEPLVIRLIWFNIYLIYVWVFDSIFEKVFSKIIKIIFVVWRFF